MISSSHNGASSPHDQAVWDIMERADSRQVQDILESCCGSPSPSRASPSPPPLLITRRDPRCDPTSTVPRPPRLHLDDGGPPSLPGQSQLGDYSLLVTATTGLDTPMPSKQMPEIMLTAIPQTDGPADDMATHHVGGMECVDPRWKHWMRPHLTELPLPHTPSALAGLHADLEFDHTKGYEGEGPKAMYSPPPKRYSRRFSRTHTDLTQSRQDTVSATYSSATQGTTSRTFVVHGGRPYSRFGTQLPRQCSQRETEGGLASRYKAVLRAIELQKRQPRGNRLDCIKLDLQSSDAMVDQLVRLMQQDASPQAIRPHNWEHIRQRYRLPQRGRHTTSG